MQGRKRSGCSSCLTQTHKPEVWDFETLKIIRSTFSITFSNTFAKLSSFAWTPARTWIYICRKFSHFLLQYSWKCPDYASSKLFSLFEISLLPPLALPWWWKKIKIGKDKLVIIRVKVDTTCNPSIFVWSALSLSSTDSSFKEKFFFHPFSKIFSKSNIDFSNALMKISIAPELQTWDQPLWTLSSSLSRPLESFN